MSDPMRVPLRLSWGLLALMLVQSLMGLALQSVYRDAEWIRAAWFGNDLVTLVVVVPLLSVALSRAASGSVRGTLLWLGGTGYAVYNYAFYLFGAALNAFFPIYVGALVLAGAVLIIALPRLDARRCGQSIHPAAPVRFIGGALVFVAGGLVSVWIGMWAAYVFAGRPTPVEPDAFKLVAALDLSLMVPALLTGGVLMWRRTAWGLIVAAIASVQAALYLLGLSVSSVVSIRRGLAVAPGELPVWGTLAIFTGTVALVLFASVRTPPSPSRQNHGTRP